MPRALALNSYFWVKMGRGGLGVETKKVCIIERNNILKFLKKVVTEKVVKSKKPKKCKKNGRFFTPRRPIF